MTDLDASRDAGLRLKAEIARHLGRDKKFSSQRQLAKAAGVGATTMSQWWPKGVVPDTATLDKVAKQLGIPTSLLTDALGGTTTDDERGYFSRAEVEAMMEGAAQRAVQLAAEELRRASRGE